MYAVYTFTHIYIYTYTFANSHLYCYLLAYLFIFNVYIRSLKFRYHSGYMGMCRAWVAGLKGLGLRVWGRGALRLGLGGVG